MALQNQSKKINMLSGEYNAFGDMTDFFRIATYWNNQEMSANRT